MNLSEHFTYEEGVGSSTALRLSIDNTPSADILSNMRVAATAMERVRYHVLWNFAVHVDSWYRCPELNAKVGGAKDSAHMSGWAIDFTCEALGTPSVVAARIAASDTPFDQLIQEGTWTHVSFDPRARHQILTAHFGPGGTTYT